MLHPIHPQSPAPQSSSSERPHRRRYTSVSPHHRIPWRCALASSDLPATTSIYHSCMTRWRNSYVVPLAFRQDVNKKGDMTLATGALFVPPSGIVDPARVVSMEATRLCKGKHRQVQLSSRCKSAVLCTRTAWELQGEFGFETLSHGLISNNLSATLRQVLSRINQPVATIMDRCLDESRTATCAHTIPKTRRPLKIQA